jgi:hypothetical protein
LRRDNNPAGKSVRRRAYDRVILRAQIQKIQNSRRNHTVKYVQRCFVNHIYTHIHFGAETVLSLALHCASPISRSINLRYKLYRKTDPGTRIIFTLFVASAVTGRLRRVLVFATRGAEFLGKKPYGLIHKAAAICYTGVIAL